jgi:hypothetical protein
MQKYSNLTALELRGLYLNGELDGESMSMEDFEKLFGHEIALADPSATVLDFCTLGLDRFDKYCSDMPMPTLESVLQKRKAKKIPKARRFVPTSRWGKLVATFVAVFIGAALLAQGVAYALGYNLFGMIWQAISNSDRAAVDVSGDNQIFLSDTRFYDSIEELLETENLDILFPTRLPIGYAFTDFVVDNTGNQLRIEMTAKEPYILFGIRIGANFQLDFDYEINGIQYSIDEMGDGLYQGHWIDGADYYTIVVSDRAIISEIINNLARE